MFYKFRDKILNVDKVLRKCYYVSRFFRKTKNFVFTGRKDNMIQWSDSLSVGIESIDEQHKELISIIQRIGDIVKTQSFDLTSISEIVAELDDYVRVHFSHEEELMQESDYPEKETHIKQHDALRDKLDTINVFDVDDYRKFINETLMFLIDWLSGHILKVDKRLGAYLQENGYN